MNKAARAYYNENDRYAAQWLRNLVEGGYIAPGDVDTRSIVDVSAADLDGYTQCHFFAGIGVWSYALRIAGISDDEPIWTGSCPCQPFSQAGGKAGFKDKRHLWPEWKRLIADLKPRRLFGEQVAGPDAGEWIDTVQDDLEALGYAFGAVAFPSAGVGAPHIRDRCYYMADADNAGLQRRIEHWNSENQRIIGPVGVASQLAYTKSSGRPRESIHPRAIKSPHGNEGHSIPGGATAGFWTDADWLWCTDGQYRPVEPGSFPLAYGVANRVGKLRAYGNAINPHAAAAFIRAAM